MSAAHVTAQNAQFGRTADRHTDDRVAAPIDGSACVLLDALISQRDAGIGRGGSGQPASDYDTG
jgi:hypothetical protein